MKIPGGSYFNERVNDDGIFAPGVPLRELMKSEGAL